MKFKEWISSYLRDTANISEQVDVGAAAANIRSNIYFRGPNVWILAFSIIIASVGLNVNSTAVIIGAMLISPVMGPIIGMGLGLGVNDTKLLGDSFRNLLIMVGISLIASSLFFLISPLNLANPTELEARTSPSIYDVLIALFGGFAGILEHARKEKGTVMSGVAIATALMPPLCTAGFGLAKGNWHFFLGAMYLFTINAIFIMFATYLACKYLHFQQKSFADERTARRTRTLITAVVLLVTIPSIWSAFIMIRNNNFTTNAQNFVSENRMYARAYIYDYKISNGSNRAVTLYLSGEALNDQERLDLVELAGKYGIKANELKIKENAIDSDDQSKKLVEGIYERMDRQLEAKENEILALQATVDSLNGRRIPYEQITAEAIAQYPQVTALHLSRGATVEADSTRVDGILAIVYCDEPLAPENKVRLENWLRVRLGGDVALNLLTINDIQ
ncbi:MAG: TIGR00341 family protein [Bacteroidales bacterium]|nr:TIGR00341 family protein [Bacteroidales bacterium]